MLKKLLFYFTNVLQSSYNSAFRNVSNCSIELIIIFLKMIWYFGCLKRFFFNKNYLISLYTIATERKRKQEKFTREIEEMYLTRNIRRQVEDNHRRNETIAHFFQRERIHNDEEEMEVYLWAGNRERNQRWRWAWEK